MYDVVYCTILYCTVLYYTGTVLYCTILYCTVLYCTVLYCTVLYCTVLCYTVLYCTVLYCTEKHPPAQPLHLSILVSSSSLNVFHPVLFDSITPELVRSFVLKINGSAGPSGLDAAAWKRLCTSFQSSSVDLCSALASLTRRLCTSYVDPSGLYPLLASRLIALDKLPGVRPIGVGEVVRRLMGRIVLNVVGQDVLEVTGCDQLCAGLPGGCEAAVHSVRQLFESTDCEAVFLADARNAFNSLNRRAALLNIHSLCPSLAPILTNCYRLDIPLFIDGDVIFSSEGTTQGDPLAMSMYAIAILPLIHHLNQFTIHQVWYANDAATLGKLSIIKSWWEELQSHGPSFGYYTNPFKSWLIVKPVAEDSARSIFADTDINITSEGHRYLGSPIGSEDFISNFIQDKISEWVSQLERLTAVAQTQPHAS